MRCHLSRKAAFFIDLWVVRHMPRLRTEFHSVLLRDGRDRVRGSGAILSRFTFVPRASSAPFTKSSISVCLTVPLMPTSRASTSAVRGAGLALLPLFLPLTKIKKSPGIKIKRRTRERDSLPRLSERSRERRTEMTEWMAAKKLKHHGIAMLYAYVKYNNVITSFPSFFAGKRVVRTRVKICHTRPILGVTCPRQRRRREAATG